MRNILNTIAIATLTFIATVCQAQNASDQAYFLQEAESYKAIVAFNIDKQSGKDFKKAFTNLQLRVEGYDVQVIKANKGKVSIMDEGKVVFGSRYQAPHSNLR